METRLKYVRVTNNFDRPYIDMFDGIPVHIDPGGTQNIRPEQAWHFFGYVEGGSRESMALHTAKRQGWNTVAYLERDENGRTLAERMFDKLIIEPVVFQLVEERAVDPDQPIAAEPTEDDADDEPEMAAPPPKPKPTTKRR